MFQFRSIFFGISENGRDSSDYPGPNLVLPESLSYSLAGQMLRRFLETLYHLMPFQSAEQFERQMDELYTVATYTSRVTPGRHIVLTAIALAALNTEHHRLADVLVAMVKDETAKMAEIVNLEAVQTSLILISPPKNTFDMRFELTSRERPFPK
jgi:hypothetical protein